MKEKSTMKVLIVLWAVLGTVSLIVGVTRITFAVVWLLFLIELYRDYLRLEKEDGVIGEILCQLRAASSDAWADMGIDDTEKDAIYDDGRHAGIEEAIRIIEGVENGENES